MIALNKTDPSVLISKLQYKFKDMNLILEALRHSSYVNEQKEKDMRDNERLEFLGDAVLNLVIGHILMKRFPDTKEGNLSRMRASLVNESQLANLANRISLGEYILLGKGEIQTNGRQKKSILSDTFEAIIAAVYLDGGFEASYQMIENHFSPIMEEISSSETDCDYKSKLQEFVQNKNQEIPNYIVIHESGPDHDKTFTVQVTTLDISVQGSGKSKKLAEQDAAKKVHQILNPQTEKFHTE
jgi:ribonuclease III